METMKQMTLSAGGFERYGKTTRRAAFLAEMDRVVPWGALCALIEPVYPKAGNGRPPIGLERMLRIYFLQNWFNLSDPAVEEALYDSLSMRSFVGIDPGHVLVRGHAQHRAAAQAIDVIAKEGLWIGLQQRQHGLIQTEALPQAQPAGDLRQRRMTTPINHRRSP